MKTQKVVQFKVTLEPDEAAQLLDYINKNRKPEDAVADLYAELTEFVAPRIGG